MKIKWQKNSLEIVFIFKPTSTPTGFDPMSNKDGSKFTADKLQGGQPKRGIQTHPDGKLPAVGRHVKIHI